MQLNIWAQQDKLSTRRQKSYRDSWSPSEYKDILSVDSTHEPKRYGDITSAAQIAHCFVLRLPSASRLCIQGVHATGFECIQGCAFECFGEYFEGAHSSVSDRVFPIVFEDANSNVFEYFRMCSSGIN